MKEYEKKRMDQCRTEPIVIHTIGQPYLDKRNSNKKTHCTRKNNLRYYVLIKHFANLTLSIRHGVLVLLISAFLSVVSLYLLAIAFSPTQTILGLGSRVDAPVTAEAILCLASGHEIEYFLLCIAFEHENSTAIESPYCATHSRISIRCGHT